MQGADGGWGQTVEVEQRGLGEDGLWGMGTGVLSGYNG